MKNEEKAVKSMEDTNNNKGRTIIVSLVNNELHKWERVEADITSHGDLVIYADDAMVQAYARGLWVTWWVDDETVKFRRTAGVRQQAPQQAQQQAERAAVLHGLKGRG